MGYLLPPFQGWGGAGLRGCGFDPAFMPVRVLSRKLANPNPGLLNDHNASFL